jgi:phage baseplate assembly protein W
MSQEVNPVAENAIRAMALIALQRFEAKVQAARLEFVEDSAAEVDAGHYPLTDLQARPGM